jgi:hypothetical protein
LTNDDSLSRVLSASFSGSTVSASVDVDVRVVPLSYGASAPVPVEFEARRRAAQAVVVSEVAAHADPGHAEIVRLSAQHCVGAHLAVVTVVAAARPGCASRPGPWARAITIMKIKAFRVIKRLLRSILIYSIYNFNS